MKYTSLFKKHNEPPWRCCFCGEEISELVVHHLDHDHANNALENLAAAHDHCHKSHHSAGREITWGEKISTTKKKQWKAGVYAEVFTPEVRRKAALANTGRRKTHCKHGHEFTEENTYVDRRGKRGCRACIYNRNLIHRGGDLNSLR